jgi:hypothetical protein
MVDLQTIGVLMTGVSVTFAAAYYIFTLRINMKTQQLALKTQEQNQLTRQAQLFMGINQFSYSNDWFSSYTKLLTMNLKTVEDFDTMYHDPDQVRAFHMVGGWLEGIGVLVKESLVDVRFVALLMSGVTQWYWSSYGDFILKVREERNFPRYMIEAEYLAKAVREYGEKHPDLGVEPESFKELISDLKTGK